MKKDKFLTVMAVLDSNAQKMLSELQGRIISEVSSGTQTMGIPFHITLGSYPPDMEGEVVKMISKAVSETERFPIQLLGYKDFNNRVLFLEPSIPRKLISLRKRFEYDYADGYDWVPHVTLFCADPKDINMAKELLPRMTEPVMAEVVGIELGKFFPTRMIMKEALK